MNEKFPADKFKNTNEHFDYLMKQATKESFIKKTYRNIKHKIEHSLYWLRTHTYNRYHMLDLRSPNNDYKWGWMDVDHKILLACFNLLVDYVDGEDPFEAIDWESDPEHSFAGEEIHDLVSWWKIHRPALLNAQNECFKDNGDYDFEKFCGFQERLEKEDNENLLRLMKIREFLWI